MKVIICKHKKKIYKKQTVKYVCTDLNTHHYENTPIQIYRKFHLKKLKISDKKLW